MKALLATLALTLGCVALAQVPNVNDLKNKATETGAKAAQETGTAAQQTATDTKSATAQLKTKALVNLNTASREELAKLPGIGPTRAQAIIAGRPYESVSDLKKVKGIKDGVIAKIKDMVTVK